MSFTSYDPSSGHPFFWPLVQSNKLSSLLDLSGWINVLLICDIVNYQLNSLFLIILIPFILVLAFSWNFCVLLLSILFMIKNHTVLMLSIFTIFLSEEYLPTNYPLLTPNFPIYKRHGSQIFLSLLRRRFSTIKLNNTTIPPCSFLWKNPKLQGIDYLPDIANCFAKNSHRLVIAGQGSIDKQISKLSSFANVSILNRFISEEESKVLFSMSFNDFTV